MMNFFEKLNALLKSRGIFTLVLFIVLGTYQFVTLDKERGKSDCPTCAQDIGEYIERGGHDELMLWNGARHVHDSFNRSLIQFTKSQPFLQTDKAVTTKNCIECHNDNSKTIPSFGELWVRFPKLDDAGLLVDFENAVQNEFIIRYNGTRPLYNDVRITEIMLYAYNDARRKGFKFQVEPEDSVVLSEPELEKLKPTFDCQLVFEELGLPKGDIGKSIVKGCNIFTRTADNRPSGYDAVWDVEMNCTSCHLNGGTQEYAAHVGDAIVNYPGVYQGNIVFTNTMRIERCYGSSINDIRYGSNSQTYKLLNLYMIWVAQKTDLKIGQHRVSRGVHNLRGTSARHESVIAGKVGYNKHCKSCHGAGGYGTSIFDDIDYFSPPPLAGHTSYAIGATLSYQERFASFIYHNMPKGVSYGNEILTKQEAIDIAAFINAQVHPAPLTYGNLDTFGIYLENLAMEILFSFKNEDPTK